MNDNITFANATDPLTMGVVHACFRSQYPGGGGSESWIYCSREDRESRLQELAKRMEPKYPNPDYKPDALEALEWVETDEPVLHITFEYDGRGDNHGPWSLEVLGVKNSLPHFLMTGFCPDDDDPEKRQRAIKVTEVSPYAELALRGVLYGGGFRPRPPQNRVAIVSEEGLREWVLIKHNSI
ncbi:MAG: hypothetical protein NUV80_06860 [Candidatus Berkelbacteria bacterium]|nr:hypothetical protein [Candidatus Berkelbacteria bacterium]MCR4308251.1 hypothetical protein [Candidatus Berkelbacteria bacterium]